MQPALIGQVWTRSAGEREAVARPAGVGTECRLPRLAYLKSYFRTAPMNWFFPFSLVATAMLTWTFLNAAQAAPTGSGEAVGAIMLFTLVSLALLEHAFLMMPLRDSLLWDWAFPGKSGPRHSTLHK